jgi:FkbM family methyltransferase
MKRIIKKILNDMGLDIIRLNKSPEYSLIGLRNLQINTIIDVGANIGQFASIIERVFPEATIYSFEPIPLAFDELSKWSKKIGRKVEAFNYALSDTSGEIEMYYHTDHSPSSSLLKTTEICENYYPFTKKQESIKVKSITLDKAIEDLNIKIKPELLIKLDVQGYEDRVIKGGEKTFKMAKACILEIGLDNLYADQADFREIIDLLYMLGFKYVGNLSQTYAEDGHVIYIDSVFTRRLNDEKNKL